MGIVFKNHFPGVRVINHEPREPGIGSFGLSKALFKFPAYIFTRRTGKKEQKSEENWKDLYDSA